MLSGAAAELGQTIYEVAKRSGLPLSSVRNALSGTRPSPQGKGHKPVPTRVSDEVYAALAVELGLDRASVERVGREGAAGLMKLRAASDEQAESVRGELAGMTAAELVDLIAQATAELAKRGR